MLEKENLSLSTFYYAILIVVRNRKGRMAFLQNSSHSNRDFACDGLRSLEARLTRDKLTRRNSRPDTFGVTDKMRRSLRPLADCVVELSELSDKIS